MHKDIKEVLFTGEQISAKCQELAKEKAAGAAELEELYEKWEEIQ